MKIFVWKWTHYDKEIVDYYVVGRYTTYLLMYLLDKIMTRFNIN